MHYLMLRYLTYVCTPEERIELAGLISKLTDDELYTQIEEVWLDFDSPVRLSKEKAIRMLSNILEEEYQTKGILSAHISRKVIRTMTAAATILLLVGIGTFIKHFTVDSTPSSQAVFAKAVLVSPDRATSYIRHLTLPDGTSVILKSGSTLHFPEEFRGRTREVILSGEAYFDVKHMNSKPFIIHTGNVKTTVLGTAFDVKAWPGQKNVIVSVTRGKVRVEDDKKVLAVLVRNEQLKYNGVELAEVVKKVVAEKIVTDWTKEDMVFDHVALGSIAQTLGNRYGVNITITNLQLAKAEIVSAFSGTESLQNVLDVLCTINPNTHFNIKEKEVVISNN